MKTPPREMITITDLTLTELLDELSYQNESEEWYNREPIITIIGQGEQFKAMIRLYEQPHEWGFMADGQTFDGYDDQAECYEAMDRLRDGRDPDAMNFSEPFPMWNGEALEEE